jgi:hypothetical protein
MEAEKSRERMKEANYILDCDKAKEVKYIQSNSVITNSTGPPIFIRYSREALYTKL